MPDLTFLSATSMAEQIRQKKLSPVELVEAHLAKIARLNPQLNAFVQVDSDTALRQARVAEHSVTEGQSLGPLHGVPLSIKSSIDVGGGFRCEAGTRLRAGCVPSPDAPLVARLRKAGAIILGVTNTPELLMAWETDNLLYGRTNNPWDMSRTPGGSSGGESAAIAAGLSAGGVGSDGGGSIREPAHFTGICGLKPTPGRIPSTGHFPKSGGPFALLGVVGPMARTVADLKLLFEAMAGPDDGDPCSANLLSQRGLRVEPFRPDGLQEARQLWWKFFGIAGGMILGPMLRGHESELSPILREFISWTAAEPSHTGDSLLATWLGRDDVRERVLLQMRNYPVLLCPTASIPAFRHGEREWQVGGKTVKYLDAWSYCEWFNLLGFPAMVVPMGRSPEGLPIGVQIVGRPWEEERVLAVASVLEEARGEWPQSPMASA